VLRRRLRSIGLWLGAAGVLALLASLVLSLPVETRQGVDYVVQTKQIPLILKVVGFYNRHLHYRTLVREIVDGVQGEEAQVLAVFQWVHRNIHAGTPPGLRVVDDHPWNIIVRGYGQSDQLSDVFVTLCSYLGIPAYFYMVRAESTGAKFAFSVVLIDGKWRLLDPYFGVVFRNRDGELATPEEARTDPAVLEAIHPRPAVGGTPYADFVRSGRVVLVSERGRYQSPWARLTYAFGW